MIRFTKPSDYYRFTQISLVVTAKSGCNIPQAGFSFYIWNLRGLKDGFDMLGYKALAWAYRHRLINDYSWSRDLDKIWRAWSHDTPKWLRTRAHRRSCLARQIMDSVTRKGGYIADPAMRIFNYANWRDQ